jgi:hypothetical protein
MLRRNADLVRTALLSLGCGLVVEIVHSSAIRLIAAILLLLILPGYSLCAAIFARHRLGLPFVVLLSLGLSLSSVALGSILVDQMPFGLRSRSWTLFTLLLVCAACAVAAGRRATSQSLVSLPRTRIRLQDVVLFLAAALIAAGAVGFGRTPLPANKVQGYTALWLLPPKSRSGAALRVGVQSGELQEETYRLVVRQGPHLLYIRRSLTLRPGDSWTAPIAMSSAPADRPVAVTARLYRSQSPKSVYRTVRLWFKPKGRPT